MSKIEMITEIAGLVETIPHDMHDEVTFFMVIISKNSHQDVDCVFLAYITYILSFKLYRCKK